MRGTIEGTAGNDHIDTTYPDDPEGEVITDAGVIVEAGAGDDRVHGGAGNDTFFGGEGDDILWGHDGDDSLYGGPGNDGLKGGAGNDLLVSGPGVNELYGGDDRDTLVLSADSSGFADGGDGGEDYDTLDLTQLGPYRIENLRPDSNGNGWDGTIVLLHDDGTPTGATWEFAEIEHIIEPPVTGGPDGTVEGTDGNDLIDTGYTGDPNGDMVDNGDALLPGHTGNDDLIYAYGGNDTVVAGEGNDTVYGGDGDDLIYGGPGDDTLYGDAGNDTIYGGPGDDIIYGGPGNDEIYGGDGDDIIDTRNSDGFAGIGLPDRDYPGLYPADPDPLNDLDTVYGGDGNDRIFTGDDADLIYGGAGDDYIESGVDDDIVHGQGGNDTIIAGEGSDTVYGGAGDDIIYGGYGPGVPDAVNIPDDAGDLRPDNGRDVLYGGDGNDTIYGMDDDDTLFGGNGDDYLDGGIDNDLLYGGNGNDTVLGGHGNDTLFGNDGDDTLFGGEGDDSIMGQRGNDLIYGGDGDDRIHDGVGDNTIYGGAGNDTITTGMGNDTIHGDDGDDWIRAGGGDDVVYGGAGNDTIYGALGDDTIFAGSGDDVIYGGRGNDTIHLGEGTNTVYGGADRDTFYGATPGSHVDGGSEGDDWDTLDLTGVDFDRIEYTSDDREDGIVWFHDGTSMTFEDIEVIVPCFTPGTAIATPRGERLVEELQVGDRIITRDNGIQEIRWLGHKEMSGKALAANPHLKPIMIKAGALGNGLPERDILVSPNHRILVANDRTQLYFEESEVLAAAKHLVGAPGIQALDVIGTTYIHFMFDRHEVVLSNGAWTESFQPGDYSLKGVGNAQRTEIFELFPELKTREGLEDYQAARKLLKKHEAQLLVR